MWEDFVKYNSIRTNFLKTFVKMNLEAGDNLLPLFLQEYEETNSIFQSWLYILGLVPSKNQDNKQENKQVDNKILERLVDYKDKWWNDSQILKYLKELFPEMLKSNYDIRNLEKDVPNFSPLAIEEFYLITKGKYYLGYDLDEDLSKMIDYVKDQNLVETYLYQIMDYFKFRYDHFDLSLLCEYNAFPFGIHETRRLHYKQTGKLEFDYPREMYKYDVKELISKYLDESVNIVGTRLINIRGTNGSGKTTMVNNIYLDSVEKGKAEEKTVMLTDNKGKEHKRYYDLLIDKKLILLGGYNSPYGTKGTDRVGDVSEIINGILYLISNYPGWTIIVESATVSTSFWSYAILYAILQSKGVTINIIHLWMRDWNFIVNNIKNRTKRKEGAKEPDYQGAIDKREILFKNHFRFSSILGRNSMLIMYPDCSTKDTMHLNLNEILINNTRRGIL
jgi:hypothetical protein